MRRHNGGISLGPVDDTMCLSYVLDAGKVGGHSMDYLAGHWLDHDTIKYEDVCGKGAKKVPSDRSARKRLWIMLPRMPTSRCGCGRCSVRVLPPRV